MLTVSEPIKLNTARSFTTFSPPDGAWSDPFYERIAGAYSLMAMDFTPKDLLLLLFATPETPIGDGGMTSLLEVEQNTYARSFLLNIVNNVLNRITLSDSQDFTYQDDIYVSSVLRRLGITDITNFMREYSHILNENKQTFRLMNLYEQNSLTLKKLLRAEVPSEVKPETTSEEDAPVTASGSLPSQDILFTEVIRRLDMENIVNKLSSYHASYGDTIVSNSAEISLATWRGMTNAINLYEARRSLSVTEVDFVYRHENSYETGEGIGPVADEAEVLGHATAAAIINIAEQSLLSQMSHMSSSDVHVRVDVTNALPAVAAPTLERFRELYMQRQNEIHAEKFFESRLLALDGAEESLIELAGETMAPVPANRVLLASEPIEAEVAEVEALSTLSEDTVLTLREMYGEILKERVHIGQIVDRSRVQDKETLMELLTDSVSETSTISGTHRETLQLVFPEPMGRDRAEATGATTAFGQTARLSPEERIRQIEEVIRHGEEAYETLAKPISGSSDGGDGLAAPMIGVGIEPQLTSDERLKEELDAVDRRNKEMAKSLEARAGELAKKPREERPRSGDERRRTAEAALLVMNDTERLKELILEDDEGSKRGKALPPELTLLLTELAPEYRVFYEELLGDVQGAIQAEDGKIRNANLPEFNAQIAAAGEQTVAELEHLELEHTKETDLLTERTSLTIERTAAEASRRVGPKTREDWHSPLRLLHKEQIITDVSEAATQQEDAGRASPVQRTKEIQENVFESREIETQINRVVRDAQVQNAAEIGSMIDRALSAQLGTIAGQVYSQVERRLDMERSRRGK
ncbi:MAG: hypothetical protein LBN34_02805 [Clostridiales Family XIII bacterium]|jgi:hypothetical protein|nr:hypothetical protein [Clostridiales Family XIII bacterium]